MIPRRARLPRHGFGLLRTLSKAHSAHLTLAFGEGQPVSGSAVVVPKKAAKKASSRHQLKRRLRALLMPHTAPGRALILLAKSGADALPFPVLKEEANTLLSRLRSQ
jgi:ribonuclease P protein component